MRKLWIAALILFAGAFAASAAETGTAAPGHRAQPSMHHKTMHRGTMKGRKSARHYGTSRYRRHGAAYYGSTPAYYGEGGYYGGRYYRHGRAYYRGHRGTTAYHYRGHRRTAMRGHAHRTAMHHGTSMHHKRAMHRKASKGGTKGGVSKAKAKPAKTKTPS